MQISTSFVQDQRHATKSARFVPVQPSQMATVLADHGFHLGHLKTGLARLPDRAHHQTTIARYVGSDALSSAVRGIMGDGSSLDLLVRAPHLTGAIELRLGFFRGSCANQWNAGKLLASVRVPHVAGCLEALNRAIPQLVGQRDQLATQIQDMSQTMVTAQQLATLTQRVAALRIGAAENVQRVHVADLLRPRRVSDRGSDLFTVANVLQENALRFGLRYDIGTGNDVRHMTTRKVVESSGSAIELTGNIWEAAAELLNRPA